MATHCLITAGPTREAIDPVRFLSNRSSGKMGFSLAAVAAEWGWQVTLVAGPVSLPTPAGVHRVDVVSAEEMLTAVTTALPDIQVAVMAAAVADYRPAHIAEQKIKKTADRLVIELERTPDILGSLRDPLGYRGLLAGFAAETELLEEYALTKLHRKGCDFIVANDVSQPGIGFESDENAASVFFADGRCSRLPRQSKMELAREIIRLAATELKERQEAIQNKKK